MNMFLTPSECFKKSIEAPSIPISIIIVIIAGIIFGGFAYTLTGNILAGVATGIILFAQWLVLSIIYWIAEFMFTPKKKTLIRTNFSGIATAVGKLWVFVIIAGIFFAIALLGGFFSAIAGIIIFILSILFIIDSFVLMRTILDTSNGRAFIAWIISIIIFALLMGIASNLTTLILI
jgi:hypothetical protein